MIPYGKHQIDQQDISKVVDLLENHFLTQGKKVPEFEQALCRYTGADHAIAVNSATSALHIACIALELKPEDSLWTSPISFVASANCARYCGASVDFVDVDAHTLNICPEALKTKLAWAEKHRCIPKVLVVVHFGGASASMREISELVKPYNIAIVEDAAHALGGSYQGRKVGSCQYSDMTVFSFHPVKSITTAEGGAVVTCDEKLAQKLRLFANHGVTRDVSLMESSLAEGQGSWYYQQIELGYNYRLSDLHAVLGISQMTKLDGFIERRTQLAAEYDQALDSLPLLLPDQKIGKHSAWHLYAVQLLEHDRLAIYNALHRSGIAANVHYIPIHLQPYYQQLGFKKGDYPVAESCYHRLLTLPLYPDFSTEQQHRVIDTLHTLLT